MTARQTKPLVVAIMGQNAAWQSYLDSEGINYRNHQDISTIPDASILILPRELPRSMKMIALCVLEQGGSVIAEPEATPSTASEVSQPISYPFHATNFSSLSDTNNTASLTIDIRCTKNGIVIQLPFSLSGLWCDRKVERSYVYTGLDERPRIWENLPAITRKNVRKVLIDVLWRAHHAAGLPLVQKWYWPRGAQSVFCFRGDMDAGDEVSMRRYLDAVRPWAESLSLFVCGSSYAGKERLLKDVVDLGAEVGNHTYTHYVYSEKTLNQANLELTENLLANVGIQTKGFVGPASFWDQSMYEVLQEKGYEYTSSFAVDHDTLPYFPPRERGGAYNMVEIPFHCLGDRFPKFGLGLNSDAVLRFFEQLIEKKYQSSEAINLYGHPDMLGRMGDTPVLIEHICRKAMSFGNVWTGNMRDLSSWWRKRHVALASIEYDISTNRLLATGLQADPDVYWSIKVAEKGQYLISGEDLCKGISLDSLEHLPWMNLQSSMGVLTGEVIERSSSKGKLMQLINDSRRDFRRKRQKIQELKSACKQQVWRGHY